MPEKIKQTANFRPVETKQERIRKNTFLLDWRPNMALIRFI